MSFLGKLEKVLTAAIESSFSRVFGGKLEPAQIARKLAASMAAGASADAAGRSVPNRYEVRLHPDDYDALEPDAAYLEERWTALLYESAKTLDASPPAPISVRMVRDGGAATGVAQIDAYSSKPRAVAGVAIDGQASPPVTGRDGVVAVGRGADNDLVLADPSVSRKHAQVDLRAMRIDDLGSRNGTYLNGTRVQSASITVGDEVRVGATSLRIVNARVRARDKRRGG